MKWFWTALYILVLFGVYWWLIDPDHDHISTRIFIGVVVTWWTLQRIYEGFEDEL